MIRGAIPLVAGAVCAACAGGPALPTLGPQAGGEVSNLSVPALSMEPSLVQTSSAEVYSRIARGANLCWFGGRGRLARSHIFHADAAPSMNGGAVEITVHERAHDQPKPWGYKAYRVSLTEVAGLDGSPGSGGTRIAVENARIPDAEAARMRAEVFQWAAGSEGCRADPDLDAARAAEAAAAAPAPPPAKAAAPKAPAKASAAKAASPAATPGGGRSQP